MLNATDNDLLCRTSPGTPMGELFRRYLAARPALRGTAGARLPARAAAHPGRGPGRLPRHHRPDRLLDATARTAARPCSSAATKRAACAASTTAGSSTSTGNCVDMPNEPAESNFKDKIRTTAYPCRGMGRHDLGLHGARGQTAGFAAALRLVRRRAEPASEDLESGSRSRTTPRDSRETSISTHVSFLHRWFTGSGGGTRAEIADGAPRANRTRDGLRIHLRRPPPCRGRSELTGGLPRSSCPRSPSYRIRTAPAGV